MPKHKPAEQANCPGPMPFVVDPNGVYRPDHIRAALGLRPSSLRTEWKRGRLRIVRRCGRNYLLGRDVLAWLDGGELPSPSARNGHSAN